MLARKYRKGGGQEKIKRSTYVWKLKNKLQKQSKTHTNLNCPFLHKMVADNLKLTSFRLLLAVYMLNIVLYNLY